MFFDWRSFLVAILFLGHCLADTFDECAGAESFSFVESPKSCAHFIYCDGDDSYDGECEEGEYFSADMQLCEPMGDIDCRTGLALVEAPPETQENTQDNNSGVAVTPGVPNSTISAELNTTQAPGASVTTRPSANETGASASGSGVSGIDLSVANQCPSLDNQNRIVLLPNANSCSDYFICYRGEALPMSCAASLHFNSRTGKCDHPENVKCLTLAFNPREQCKRTTIDVYPHADNCNYFYQCRLGFLMVQQCPFFYGWDYEKRSCVALSQAKCYNRVQMQMKL
ncbi:hypothetical protein KR018_011702 [Drosophila ironensis]|nr:hypothetical protein KR018_011702 [Drosophila ironensis]